MNAHVVDPHSVALQVAPGEPDLPKRARAFIASWWEKKPEGWCFVTKRLGEEGRALVHCNLSDPQVLTALFGADYTVTWVNRLLEERSHA